MNILMKRIKNFIYYLIYKSYPVAEYVVGATDSLGDTIAIMDKCPWTFRPFETVKLFFYRYLRIVIRITITGIFWAFYGEQIATELFCAFTMPSWMLPICLFGTSEIFVRVIGEVLFGYE